ncbi:MAG TPA: TolC family protein [Bryobacteraceae bacterium]|nr:TolC family protein [Bryobacteraceae bacterium]
MSRRLLSLVLLSGGLAVAPAQTDYSKPASAFPWLARPYRQRTIPEPDLTDGDLASMVQNRVLHLSLSQVIDAVVTNNLNVAAARYNPSIAQTDLLRARSGNSPRGLDVARIPSGVFAGAEGGSILGTAGGGGGGSSNPGGITGSAGPVNVRPSGVFDPSLRLSFSLDHTNSPLNTVVVAGVPSVTTTTAAFSVNYVQAFSSGTSIAASYGMQRQGSTQLHLLFNPDFTPGFTATISQQVLNGFGFAVNRALIKVAENEQQIERESFRQQAIAALASAEGAYWDLAATQAAVRSAQQALDVAQQLVKDNETQLRAGTMAPIDVVTAQAQVAAAQRDLVVAKTGVQNAELQLKSMIVKNLDEPLASASIEVTDSFPDPVGAHPPTLEEAIATAKENRPELSIAQGNIKSQADVMPFIRNALLPNFNVFGLVTTVGLYNVFGTSLTEAIHFRYPEYAFGVSISFPLKNRQAQADDIRSRLELRQAKDTLVRSESQVEVEVQNALIAVRNAAAQAMAANAAQNLARDKFDAEEKKLNSGLSTSYNVILAQRDVFTADLAYVQARDTFAKALVSLDQMTGVTLDTAHVSLDRMLRGR